MTEASDPSAEFIEAACVPVGDGHATGDLSAAERILAGHPEIATASIHAAAILGDDAAVRRHLGGIRQARLCRAHRSCLLSLLSCFLSENRR